MNREQVTFNYWKNHVKPRLDTRPKDFDFYTEPSWIDFQKFVADMGLKPEGHSKLVCKKGENSYTPTTCQWKVYSYHYEKPKAEEKLLKQGLTKGGLSSRHPLFSTWHAMWRRCTNPNDRSYKWYKDRVPSDDWRNFANFVRDMGEKPDGAYSLDRIDNTKHYCKENCRWATSKTQGRNKSNTILIDLDGKLTSMADVAEIAGLSHATLYYRMRSGYPEGELINPSTELLSQNKEKGLKKLKENLRTANEKRFLYYTIDGKTQSIKAWAAEYHFSSDGIRRVRLAGGDVLAALKAKVEAAKKKFPTTLDTLKSTQLPEIKSNPDTIHNSVLTLS